MNEPVGNSPRGTNIPGNSHKVREEQAAKTGVKAPTVDAPVKEATTKIVEGKVISRKPKWYKRAAASMIAEDIPNVGEAVFFDVIMPGIKQLIRNAAVGSIDRILLGKVQPTTGQSIVGSIVGANASRIGMNYNHISDGRAPGLSQSQRARHAFNEITLANLEEANYVLAEMIGRIQLYGAVSVADLYGYLGITNPQGNYMDRGFGWTDLSTASVRQVGDGWMLDLPNPEPFRT